MTLIVSAATTDYILQAADCRVSRGERVKEFRDEEIKAVTFGKSAIFGFTGRSYVDDDQSQRTDHWLCEALAGSTDLLEQLRVLTDRVNHTFAWRRDALAFAATAWAVIDDEVAPFLALLSNFHQDNGKATAEIQSEFKLRVAHRKGSQKTLMHFVGANLRDDEDDKLERIISNLAVGRFTINGALHAMAKAIRRVAERDDTVGRGILLTAIPKAALLGNAMGSCSYMPADSNTTVSKMPHGVFGGAIIRDVEYVPIYSSG